jgi:large subunit ribosomal protein L4
MTATATADETVEAEVIEVTQRSADGTPVARVALDPAFFGVKPNVPLMHQVVVGQMAARRSGTQSTKTRAEVSGGGAKPYRQKGTGRARQGSIRAPHFEGGGVALGPKPRSYKQRTPRKMVQLALRCALSERAAQRRVCLVDHWAFTVPKTKAAEAAIDALDLDGRILVVLDHDDVIAERSFDNLPYVELTERAQLTAYEVLCCDWIVFTDASLPGEATVLETLEPPARSAESAPDDDAASKTAGAAARRRSRSAAPADGPTEDAAEAHDHAAADESDEVHEVADHAAADESDEVHLVTDHAAEEPAGGAEREAGLAEPPAATGGSHEHGSHEHGSHEHDDAESEEEES